MPSPDETPTVGDTLPEPAAAFALTDSRGP